MFQKSELCEQHICVSVFHNGGFGREGKGREGTGREGKGREGKGREGTFVGQKIPGKKKQHIVWGVCNSTGPNTELSRFPQRLYA